ncbi:MAG: energy coupling factor transporter S component ThiW [Clostridium sp.]
MKNNKGLAYRLALSGIFIAISTVLGTFSIPVLGAKISPIQHFINVLAAITLGPVYAVGCAFTSSLLRNILATGSLLAFPGSMIGAFCAGLLYKKYKNVEVALGGEIIGTGILGAIVAYPISALLLGRETAVLVYILPFTLSSFAGGVLAYLILKVPSIRKVINKE